MTKILLVEDDALVREALKRVLKEGGYTVFEASDGEEGLSLFSEICPDLVITDIIMPNRDGLETIMEIKRRSPDTTVVAISGGGYIKGEDYLGVAGRLGAAKTLIKPFGSKTLLETLDGLLRRRT
jgi:YesN/AraC family two-component response regulator